MKALVVKTTSNFKDDISFNEALLEYSFYLRSQGFKKEDIENFYLGKPLIVKSVRGNSTVTYQYTLEGFNEKENN